MRSSVSLGMAGCDSFNGTLSSSSIMAGFINNPRCESFDEDPRSKAQKTQGNLGPVAIFWDIENCPVPADTNTEDVAGNIRMALQLNPVIKGAVTTFSAYGDFNQFPRRLREGCQRTGVNLVDVPNRRKDASDKAILVDMFLFALDNPPPSTLLLVSGDVDFAPALHKLGQRGYVIVLAIPASVGVSPALCSAGQFVWDWPSLARGDGLAAAKAFSARATSGFSLESGYFLSATEIGSGESDLLNKAEPPLMPWEASSLINANLEGEGEGEGEDEGDINEDLPDSVTLTAGAVFQHDPLYPKPVRVLDTTSYHMDYTIFTDKNSPSSSSWVRPGDVRGLKGQLVQLLLMNKGQLTLARVQSEYCKLFGRPLFLAEYGSSKLVQLLERMSDAFSIRGEGTRKSLHLKDSNRSLFSSSRQRRTQEKTHLYCEHGIDVGCLEEAYEKRRSKDPKNIFEDIPTSLRLDEEAMRVEVFKQELQELLVSCACKIYLASFVHLYERRYGHELDLRSLGVDSLDSLMEKVKDVASMMEEPSSGHKFIVANGSYPVVGLR